MSLTLDNSYTTDQVTTNATLTTIQTLTPEENSQVSLQMTVQAKSDDGDYRFWNIIQLFNRDGSGNVTKIGSLQNLFSSEYSLGALTWGIQIDVSGADILIKVAGSSGKTIAWQTFGRALGHIPTFS